MYMTTIRFCNSNYIDTVLFLNHFVYTYRSITETNKDMQSKTESGDNIVPLVINFSLDLEFINKQEQF